MNITKKVTKTFVAIFMMISMLPMMNLVINAESNAQTRGATSGGPSENWTQGNGYGTAEVVSDNITLLKGDKIPNKDGRYAGPFTKKGMKSFETNSVVDMEVNVKIDPKAMNKDEKFKVSAALDDGTDFVTELRVLFTKLADGSVKLTVPDDSPWTEESYIVDEAGIYTLRWEFTRNETESKLVGKFILKSGENKLTTMSCNDMDKVGGVQGAFDKTKQGRYVWFYDIACVSGLNIYNELPGAIAELPAISDTDNLGSDSNKQIIEDAIISAETQAKVELTLAPTATAVTLPKSLLEKAVEAGKELAVEVKNNTGVVAYTWYFNGANITKDVNLVVKQLKANDIVEIKELAKDGLVLDFQHSGDLPNGTKVKMNVGTEYKANDKVKVSYFNEITNKLEETKEYKVDGEGNILMSITHCSKYVVEKVVEDTPPATEDTPPATEDTPPAKENTAPDTGDISNVALFTSLMALSAMTALLFVVYKKRSVKQ